MTNNIVIYTTKTCPYCVKAKELLKSKGKSFKEVDVSDNEELRKDMMIKSNGRRSVPQIFINDKHIGGCDDLYALEAQNKLDNLLK
ncbi:Glutaredoxin-3 [Rickettsiales bacterium Ac37b]|nr:Glutaredoxin-3 [Rickettsiales bacterium Ac37b]